MPLTKLVNPVLNYVGKVKFSCISMYIDCVNVYDNCLSWYT